MQGRAVVALGVGVGLLIAGCATKKFVREEVGKTEQKVASDVGRLEGELSQEKARVTTLGQGLEQTRASAEAAGQQAAAAATAAGQAASKADEASAKAADAAGRADQAAATAKEALAKAGETDQRLTKLWANRDKRTLADTIVVTFGFDKWLLDDRAQTALLDVVKQLQEQPQLTVELEGYTDNIGANTYNIHLSQRRAESVRRFLVERGVELPRIHTIGLGDIRPVADNKTKQGRDQNRRVAIRLYAPAE
jgi:outer membrane protein OmpA-like peptidoglycan-associated protein